MIPRLIMPKIPLKVLNIWIDEGRITKEDVIDYYLKDKSFKIKKLKNG